MGGCWVDFGSVLASKSARKFQKNRKMRVPRGSRGPLEFRWFLPLTFELHGVPFGCQLGPNLGSTWRPRRFQDAPETEKKGTKNGKKEVYVGSRPELENGTQNDHPELNCEGFWHRFWKVFGSIFEGFRREPPKSAQEPLKLQKRLGRAKRDFSNP